MNSYFYIKAFRAYKIVKMDSSENMLDVIKQQLVNNKEFKSVLDEAAEEFVDYTDAPLWSFYNLERINRLLEINFLEIIPINHIEILDSDPNHYILIDDGANPELYSVNAENSNSAEEKFIDRKLSFFKGRVYNLDEILDHYDMWSHTAPIDTIINL